MTRELGCDESCACVYEVKSKNLSMIAKEDKERRVNLDLLVGIWKKKKKDRFKQRMVFIIFGSLLTKKMVCNKKVKIPVLVLLLEECAFLVQALLSF